MAAHLLLVDDSEAILAFEKTALGGEYAITTAQDGVEALERAAQVRPALIVLDLSMPRMDGDEVLSRLQADPALRHIPVVVVSSEDARARRCVRSGAAAYVPKPLRADLLSRTVARVLDEERAREASRQVALLFVRAGPLRLGLPLARVKLVALMPRWRTLPGLPSYFCGVVDVHGGAVAVMDLPSRLGVGHSGPATEWRLVVTEAGGQPLGLAVDEISDPELLEPSQLTAAEAVVPPGVDAASVLVGVARVKGESVPVIEPGALLSRDLLLRLQAAIRATREQAPVDALRPSEAAE